MKRHRLSSSQATDGTGVGSLSVPVPNVLALVGMTIDAQALTVQTPQPTRLTNVNSDVIGR